MRLYQAINHELKSQKQWLESIKSKRVLQNPGIYIEDKKIQLDRSTERLISAAGQKALKDRQRFVAAASAFDAMSPLKVLGRGYAIAESADGRIIKTAADVSKGDRIKVRLQKDEVNCIVD